MTNETKSDYALWNEYLNTPREVFVRKHRAGFSTKDLEIRKRDTPYTLIEMLTEPEGKYLEYSEPYGYETKLIGHTV